MDVKLIYKYYYFIKSFTKMSKHELSISSSLTLYAWKLPGILKYSILFVVVLFVSAIF